MDTGAGLESTDRSENWNYLSQIQRSYSQAKGGIVSGCALGYITHRICRPCRWGVYKVGWGARWVFQHIPILHLHPSTRTRKENACSSSCYCHLRDVRPRTPPPNPTTPSPRPRRSPNTTISSLVSLTGRVPGIPTTTHSPNRDSDTWGYEATHWVIKRHPSVGYRRRIGMFSPLQCVVCLQVIFYILQQAVLFWGCSD